MNLLGVATRIRTELVPTLKLDDDCVAFAFTVIASLLCADTNRVGQWIMLIGLGNQSSNFVVNAALVRFCGPIKKKLKVQSREVRF